MMNSEAGLLGIPEQGGKGEVKRSEAGTEIKA